jgi:hypothetical protein
MQGAQTMVADRKPWFIRKTYGIGYAGVRWQGAFLLVALALALAAITFVRGPA